MARIRTIKPEFFSDEKLSLLDPLTRLTFLGLVSMADDYGRVLDNTKIIEAYVFPNSSDTVREALANLSRISRIRRGKASNGQSVIEIVNWDRHQKVDKPNPKSALPKIASECGNSAAKAEFENDSREPRDEFATNSRLLPTTNDLRPTTKELRSVEVFEFPTNGKQKNWFLTSGLLDEYQKAYPELKILEECQRALAWLKSNRLKTAKGMPRFLNSWLARANDSGGKRGTSISFAQKREQNNLALVNRLSEPTNGFFLN